VYSLFSALIMHVYQMRSSNQSIVAATQVRLTTCMNALRDVSKVWLVAKMVHTLFESILGNKVMEERLQKAAGRKHARNKMTPSINGGGNGRPKETPPTELNEAQKRKFAEMELGYTNGPPAPQMSYERSRPQSPALTPAREMQQQNAGAQMPQISRNSPPVQGNMDAFMGTSRQNTRPNTPFNTFSYPGTPPDLFLHTRGSPKISDDLWQNYQPDQLFPPDTTSLFPLQSPDQQMVDPALRGPSQGPFAPPQQAQLSPNSQMHPPPPAQMQQQQAQMFADPNQGWQQFQAGMQSQQRPDDQWSNTSTTSAIVPTALNVGDWFEFFGIPNGDMNALGAGAGSYG